MSLPRVEFVESRGNLVRDCPGTRHHICCGYKTIDLVEGCILHCSYCILQHYINSPHIRVHRDVPYIVSQVDKMIGEEQDHILRFGTGELSDSLALDRRLNLNRPLIEYFGEKKKALLELKSKWASIDHLADVLNPYTIVSFSMAPQQAIGREEKRTSPLYKRLKAARKAQNLGCYVGLHFDPIIIYPGFEKDYEYLIDDIFRLLDGERIIWVSLGLLRFPAPLMDRFVEEGHRTLLAGEFIRGEDGKYRYLKSERIRVYRMLYRQLKERAADLFVYLCMEREDVWREATGITISDNEGLISLFDARIRTLYGGNHAI